MEERTKSWERVWYEFQNVQRPEPSTANRLHGQARVVKRGPCRYLELLKSKNNEQWSNISLYECAPLQIIANEKILHWQQSANQPQCRGEDRTKTRTYHFRELSSSISYPVRQPRLMAAAVENHQRSDSHGCKMTVKLSVRRMVF
jgi:hypothetical protein